MCLLYYYTYACIIYRRYLITTSGRIFSNINENERPTLIIFFTTDNFLKRVKSFSELKRYNNTIPNDITLNYYHIEMIRRRGTLWLDCYHLFDDPSGCIIQVQAIIYILLYMERDTTIFSSRHSDPPFFGGRTLTYFTGLLLQGHAWWLYCGNRAV